MAFKQKDYRKDKPKSLNVRRAYGMKKLTSKFLSVVRGPVDGPDEKVRDLNWKGGYPTMQMRKRIFLRSFLTVFFFMSGRPAMLHGAHWSESLAFTYDNGLGDTMPYRLFIPPDYDPERAYPLVLFLHGAGERGTNNTIQVSVHIDNLINATQSPQYTSFLVAPQTTDHWGSNRSRSLVDGILTEIELNYTVDSSRLYITGLSLGGYGTFDQLYHFPGRFAAAAPLSGGVGSTSVSDVAAVIKDIPTWVHHGAQDTAVPVSSSRVIVNAMRNAGGSPLYTEYPNMGHNIWSHVYADNNNEFYPWMFSQSLDGLLIEPMLLGLRSPSDFNGDSQVNIKDLILLIEHWGQNEPSIDIVPVLAGDGTIDALDLEVMMGYWGQLVQDATLKAHWNLDETEGMVAFDSTGDNDAIVTGKALWQPASGMVNGALEFNGATFVVADFVLNPSGGLLSVLAWVKDGTPGQAVISQIDGANWLLADPSEGYLMTELRSPGRGGGPLQSQTSITDGNWHRIGLVWDGLYRTLYVDSIAVAQDTQDSLGGSDSGLYIGCDKAMKTGTYWSGLIDDVSIYNRVVIP